MKDNVIDLVKYKLEKCVDPDEPLFTLNEVEEISWQFLESILSDEELQEISLRLEELQQEKL